MMGKMGEGLTVKGYVLFGRLYDVEMRNGVRQEMGRGEEMGAETGDMGKRGVEENTTARL